MQLGRLFNLLEFTEKELGKLDSLTICIVGRLGDSRWPGLYNCFSHHCPRSVFGVAVTVDVLDNNSGRLRPEIVAATNAKDDTCNNDSNDDTDEIVDGF